MKIKIEKKRWNRKANVNGWKAPPTPSGPVHLPRARMALFGRACARSVGYACKSRPSPSPSDEMLCHVLSLLGPQVLVECRVFCGAFSSSNHTPLRQVCRRSSVRPAATPPAARTRRTRRTSGLYQKRRAKNENSMPGGPRVPTWSLDA